MRPIVERSKLCLDYACTLYILHTAACVLYSGAPAVLRGAYVLPLAVSCAATTQTARYACQQVELLPIPVGSGGLPNPGVPGPRYRSVLPLFNRGLARLFSACTRTAQVAEEISLTRVARV